MKRMLPTFSTYVKRVFDGCQKLFWLFSKALVTVVKNYQNIFMCESLLLRLWHIAQCLESCTGDVYVW